MDKKDYIEKYVRENPIPPRIEVIDKFETYLLDDSNKRIRKICGAKKKSFPKGYVCKNNAGLRTTHPKWGKCHICEKERGLRLYVSLSKLNEKVLKLTGEEIYPNVKKGLEVAKEMGNKMDDLGFEADLINALLIDMLIPKEDEKDKSMTSAHMFKIVDLVKELRNLKETQFKIKKDAALDMRVISAFIGKVFGILVQVMETDKARDLMERIKAEVILPIADLSGSDGKKVNSDITKSIDSTIADDIFKIDNIAEGEITDA